MWGSVLKFAAGGATVASAVVAAVSLVEQQKTLAAQQSIEHGKFLVELDKHFVHSYSKTHEMVERHVRRIIAVDPSVVVPFDFASNEKAQVDKVQKAMPGLGGCDNFAKRREVLDYAAFGQLVWQLQQKGVLSFEDVERMYGHRICTLVAHPLVFDSIRNGTFSGPRILAFRILTKQLQEETKQPLSPEREIARWNLCQYAKDIGKLNEARVLCETLDWKSAYSQMKYRQ